MLFWRVGRNGRQSLHHLVRSLADLLSPSLLRSPHSCPSLPVSWSRSFTLTQPRVHPAPLPRHRENPVKPGSPTPARHSKRRAVIAPLHDPPIELPTSANGSPLPQEEPKDFLNISGNRASRRIFSDSRKVSRLAQHMISTRYPRGALLVLVTAHRLGCPLGKEVYESVARRLAEVREWRLITTLALLQKRYLGRRTARLLDWRIRALIEVSQFAHLDRVLGWFEEDGLLPTRRTYHLLLYGHLRNRNIAKAMDVIQHMLKAGFTIDSYTQATVVSAYRTLGPDVGVQTRALDGLKDADAKASTHILNALLQFSIDTRDSERLLLLAYHFDFGTFDACQLPLGGSRPLPREGESAVLSQLIRSSRQSHAVGRIPPDIATYTILLHYIASHADLPSALGLLEQMDRSDLMPDDRFIAALVRLYFVVGRPNAAIGVVSAMCAEVRTVFQDIHFPPEPQGTLPIPRVLPKPTIEILNALAIGMSRLCGIDGLQACLRLMQLCQVNPNGHTKALLQSHLVNAEGFFSADVGHVTRDLSPNESSSLSHLVQNLASSLHFQFRAVKRSGWNNSPSRKHSPQNRPPSLQAQTSDTSKSFDPTAGVIGVLAQPTSHMQPIIQSLSDRGVLADRRMFALRIRHEAVTKGDMTSAKGVFQMMLDRGLHPNEYHYAALMEGHAAAGEMAAAEAVMSSAERGGVRPNCVLHTILIVGYARQKNTAGAMRVLRHMVAAGVRPDVPAIDAITSVFFASGAYRLARRTLLSLWPSVAPLPRDHDRASLKMLVFHLRNLHKGRVISKNLSEHERQLLVGKLEELTKVWSYDGRSRSGTQRESALYAKGHSTLRRELSHLHLS
jgi:pentatricopeptide repeat protein